MASLVTYLRRVLARSPTGPTLFSCRSTIDTNFSIFRGAKSISLLSQGKVKILIVPLLHYIEGDRVVINGKNPLLTKPLERSKKTSAPRGTIEHDHIIGKNIRDVVKSHKGLSRHSKIIFINISLRMLTVFTINI